MSVECLDDRIVFSPGDVSDEFRPVAVKVLGALASILTANALLGNLVVSLLIGLLVLGVWCGHGPATLSEIIWHRALTLDNLFLSPFFWPPPWDIIWYWGRKLP